MKNIYLPLIMEEDTIDPDSIIYTIDDWRKGCYFNRRENYSPEYQNITMTLRCNTFKGMIQFLYMIHCKNFIMTKIHN
jgi:hypothetical protein